MKELAYKFTTSNTYSIKIIHFFSTLFLIYALTLKLGLGWWALSFFIYFCTGCLGITVTFHRYLSHKSYKMSKKLEYLFSIFGALGGTGSPLGWVALHRAHHQHSDQALDPHSPQNGKLNVFLSDYRFSLNKWAVRDLISQPFHKRLHMFYHPLLIIWASLWLAVGFRYFLFVVAVPMAIQIWVSTASNILNHSFGYRNFNTQDKSTNNVAVALISWGEGWHNNHHMYPARWNFKVKWWEFDPSSLVIGFVMQREK